MTPGDVLIVLADDPKTLVRFAVAAENHSRAALEAGLSSADPETRGLVALRKDLDRAHVDRLAGDPHHRVREQLALVATSPTLVATLARDEHPAVRRATLSNPYLSSDDVEMLSLDPVKDVRAQVAFLRLGQPETLTRLAQDRASGVRWTVLVCFPERTDIAEMLAGDSDETIANQAREQLRDPEAFKSPAEPVQTPEDLIAVLGDIPSEIRDRVMNGFAEGKAREARLP
jgi:hypothetical protein